MSLCVGELCYFVILECQLFEICHHTPNSTPIFSIMHTNNTFTAVSNDNNNDHSSNINCFV